MADEVKPMTKEEVVNLAKKIMAEGTPLLTDEAQKEYFTKTLESLETAQGMIDNEEKETRMQDAAVKFANQLCFILFREGVITPELTDQLRSLPTPESTTEGVKTFTDERDARIKALNEAHAVIVDEQKNLDLFLAVIAGMSEEEAARRMKEHDDQIQAQLNRQG